METITIPKSEYEALLARNKALEAQVKILEEKILDLHQRLFGKKISVVLKMPNMLLLITIFLIPRVKKSLKQNGKN